MKSHSHCLIQDALGDAVRSQRRKLGISQEQLAARASLHRTYIGDIERGTRNVSLINIEKIARALETTPHGLFAQVDRLMGPDHRAR
jgi:transcriptional regulator with XRE-family HTH domain